MSLVALWDAMWHGLSPVEQAPAWPTEGAGLCQEPHPPLPRWGPRYRHLRDEPAIRPTTVHAPHAILGPQIACTPFSRLIACRLTPMGDGLEDSPTRP